MVFAFIGQKNFFQRVSIAVQRRLLLDNTVYFSFYPSFCNLFFCILLAKSVRAPCDSGLLLLWGFFFTG